MITDKQLLALAKECRNAKELCTKLNYKSHSVYTKSLKPRLDKMGFKFTSPLARHTDDEVRQVANGANSVTDIMRKLGLNYNGRAHAEFRERLTRIGIDIAKFKIEHVYHKSRPIADYLVLNGPKIGSSALKKKLIAAGIKHNKCEGSGCSISIAWLGKPIRLHLDHINGNKRDCRLENLRILCPNCHDQTPTQSKIKTKSVKHEQQIKKCVSCGVKIIGLNTNQCLSCASRDRAKVQNRPSKSELLDLVWKMPTSKIAKKFNISDKAVTKWCKSYKITKPGPGYWTRSRSLVAKADSSNLSIVGASPTGSEKF